MSLFETSRPVWNEEMKIELANIVGRTVCEWANEIDATDYIETATEILDWHWRDNGFELAKEFADKLGISPDLQLVEELDDVSHEAHTILSKHIKAWVISDHVKPQHNIGSIVSVKISGKSVEGEITKLYEDTAQYGVCIESLGQIKGQSCYMINYENAELIKQRETITV